ncbi:MAG: bifunctional histidinol-phosphatase/imidazoleglycerol-phosphate dehydratase HisB [Bacteroidota bacterium]
MKKILFLDRDGTLVVEPPEDYQLDRFDKLAFLPGVIQELVRLKAATEYIWVMVTNQDGLGTEAFPEDTFWPVHNLMMNILEGEGLTFDEVVIDRTFKADKQPTRKPGTALLTHYMNGDYDLANSVVIGDRPSDIQLAKNLGAKGILLGRSTDDQDDEWDLPRLRTETLILESESWTEITDRLIAREKRGRTARVRRVTKETEIEIFLNLDGTGRSEAKTGLGFFDHMLDQLAKHGKMDLEVSVKGDLHIDAHHTIEDTALALGQAFREAIGNKRGIERYGCFNLVMDDALAEVAVDFSGRPMLLWQGDLLRDKVGEMPTEMVEHFFQSFCDQARCNLSIKISGRNAHHMVEACFKGVARAIRNAKAQIEGDDSLPSTKGVL